MLIAASECKEDAAAGMVVREDRQLCRIQILCNASFDLDGKPRQATVDMELGPTGWHLWLPLLRARVQQMQA